MSSPVNLNFSNLIRIDRRKSDAVYLQIAYQFINSIKMKLLHDGDKLPGSRILAEELKVHRKTMVSAIEELEQQGWVESVPYVGTFIRNPEENSDSKEVKSFKSTPQFASFSYRKEYILDSIPEESEGIFFFNDGLPDYRVIPSEELVRFYRTSFQRKTNSLNQSSSTRGNTYFREQLCFYLNLTRKLHLSPAAVLPITTLEQTLSVLSRLLIRAGDAILVEELSHFLPNMIFSQAGAHLKTVPLDEEGMDVDYISTHFQRDEIRFVYLRPRSQYPTTVELSKKRRKRLLELAEQLNFIIIEEDTDYDYSDSKSKNDSLFERDGGNRVVYIGGFGGFLSPGFQSHFLLGPLDFLIEAEKQLTLFGKNNNFMEWALGEIIRQGDIHRYHRKFQKTNRERKELFAQLISTHFSDKIQYTFPKSGLAFWLRFSDFISLNSLQKTAKEKGLIIPSICLYQNRNLCALRVGFSHLTPKEMKESMEILEKS